MSHQSCTERRLVPALLAVFLLWSVSGFCQQVPQGAEPEPAPLSSNEPVLSARDYSERAVQFYQSGQFAAAIQDFRAAHALRPKASFLFNIAQAHRQLGQRRQAIQMYERFLGESPNTELRAEAQGYLHKLRQEEIQASNLAQPNVSIGKSAPSNPEKVTPIYRRWWLWAGVSLVVAGGVTAAAIGSSQAAPSLPDVPFVQGSWQTR